MKVHYGKINLKQNYLVDASMKKVLPEYLYHKSAVNNRHSIMNEGLILKIGISYLLHWDYKTNLKPLIFLYDRNVLEYDTTYDDDVYKIETSKLDKRKISRDPDKSMHGCYCYSSNICPDNIEIIYKGSGTSY